MLRLKEWREYKDPLFTPVYDNLGFPDILLPEGDIQASCLWLPVCRLLEYPFFVALSTAAQL